MNLATVLGLISSFAKGVAFDLVGVKPLYSLGVVSLLPNPLDLSSKAKILSLDSNGGDDDT
nr:unnamed protein product [Callosobruchus analis]